MAGNFFGGEFFSGGFFGANDTAKTGAGGIDRGDAKRIVKPTGLLHKPRKEGRKNVETRVDDSHAIAAEVAAKLAREFGDETASLTEQQSLAEQQALAVAELSASQVEFEIGALLRKKIRTEEEELLLLLMMAAASV